MFWKESPDETCLCSLCIANLPIWARAYLGVCLENHSDLDLGNVIWAIIWCIWCIINIACYAGVLYALDKKNMRFLIPALCLSVFNILAGIINAIINFTTFSWFAAVWLLVIVGLTAYYALGLRTLLDQLKGGEAPDAEEPSAPGKNQNGVLHVWDHFVDFAL